MFFNIDTDDGHSISGWLAPDNPSAHPVIAVLIPGRPEILVEATVMRPDVRELGLHTTGLVGFAITAAEVADIATVDDIELVDAPTRMPIYRRFQPQRHVEHKLFLFDASVMPQRKITQHLARHFALNYPASERYSLETMLVVINNHFSRSIFISGRSNFNRYAGFLESGGYIRAALLRDPFEELSERLLFLSLLGKSDNPQLLQSYVTGISPLVDLARDMPFNDPKALLALFRRITDEQRLAMMSPMVRMFGGNIDEPADRRHVSLALEHLATMDVVGTRERYDSFRAMLTQFVGADVLGPESPASFQTVSVLARTLSRIGLVADLLEHDIALYALAKEAIAVGLERRSEMSDRDNAQSI